MAQDDTALALRSYSSPPVTPSDELVPRDEFIQIIGATDSRGETIIGAPIGMKRVLATIYRVLGIDPTTTFPDHRGRPQVVLDDQEPVPGLL